MTVNETVDAKNRLDRLISKARADLYKPVAIAEILFRDRVEGDVDLSRKEDYRRPSAHTSAGIPFGRFGVSFPMPETIASSASCAKSGFVNGYLDLLYLSPPQWHLVNCCLQLRNYVVWMYGTFSFMDTMSLIITSFGK